MAPEPTADGPQQTVNEPDSKPIEIIDVGALDKVTVGLLSSGRPYHPPRSPLFTYLGIVVALILGAGAITALAELNSLARATKALEGVAAVLMLLAGMLTVVALPAIRNYLESCHPAESAHEPVKSTKRASPRAKTSHSPKSEPG